MRKNNSDPLWYKSIFFAFLFIFGIGATTSTIYLLNRGEKTSLNISIIFIILFLLFPRLFLESSFAFYGLRLKDVKDSSSFKRLLLLFLLLIIFLGIDFSFSFFVPKLSQLAKEPEVSQVHSGAATAKAITPLPVGFFLLLEFVIILTDTFTEELLFRGIIEGGLLKVRERVLSYSFQLKPLIKKWSSWIIILIQGIFFGVVHWRIFNPLGTRFTPLAIYSGLYAILFGLVAGWFFLKRKSILPSFYLHFAINFLSVFLPRMI